MKPKNKKALIIFAGLAAAMAGIYFIFRKDQSRVGSFVRNVEQAITGEEEYIDDIIIESPVSTGSKYVAESFPLKIYMKGSNVKAVQTILNQLYADKIGAQLTVDGYFGPSTETALYKATGRKQLTKDQYYSLASAATAKANIEEPSFWDNVLGVDI